MENKDSKMYDAVPGDGAESIQSVGSSETGSVELLYRFGNLQGIGARENQEDSFAFSNVFNPEIIKVKGALAVVADGMGGLQGGKLASNTAVSVIRQDFASLDVEKNIPEQLNAIMRHADEEVAKAVSGKGGSTAIAVAIYQDRLYFASVGDSYLLLKRGEYLTRLNRFHNVVTDALKKLVACERMNPREAVIDDKPAALTEFLGMDGISDIDGFQEPFRLRYGDVLLICSDGVAGVLKNESIYRALSEDTPAGMCAALEAEIKSRQIRYQDNYTALVIQCLYPESNPAE